MSALETNLAKAPPRLRILHAICTSIALFSVLPTLFVTAQLARYEGILIIAFSVFTILFGHVSLSLSRRALRPTETSGRFYTSVALCMGYVCAIAGMLSHIFL